MIITILAALAFMALLRFHHAKLEDSMVRTFQKQQMDVTRTWADAVEGQVAGIHRDLASLASHPDVCRFAPNMKETLSSFLTRENTVLANIEVLDVQGTQLWSSPSVAGAESRDKAIQATTMTSRGETSHRLSVLLPIELDGRKVGTLRAGVNVATVVVRCQPKTNSIHRSLHCVLSGDGEVIYGGDTVSKPRHVIHALRDADAPKEAVRNVELLSYLTGRCVMAGNSGLAEAIRQEGRVEELIAFVPMNLEARRFGLVMGSPRADVSVPIASHERVTYALIAALALLYFATGYTAYRSERAHTQLAEHRRRAAEEASQAKGNFLARTSHELRTPMNGVISMTELAMGASDAAERQKYLGVVKECAYSLLSVINDILDMSKIEAGRLELCHVPLNVPECVTNTLASLAPLARDKGLTLTWEIDPGVPSAVSGDPGRLRQVLNNLVGNAIKFTSIGEVVVRVTPHSVGRDRAVLRFDVRDTGPGIAPDDLTRIFNPYYQCSAAGTYRKDGTGLGLAIASQLVELMGGRIVVHSQIGKGTVFTFTAQFDAVVDDAARHAACHKGRPLLTKCLSPDAGRLRILLVEDDPVSQLAASLLLSQWGHEVRAAGSGEEALSALAGRQFDLVLMDLEMPGMNGIEATAEIRGREAASGGRIPIIAMTAHALDSDRERCLAAGMDGYTSKPFRPDQLRGLIAEIASGSTDGSMQPRTSAVTPKAPDDQPVWDRSEALRLAGGNQTAVGIIIRTFLQDLRETLPAAQSAALARDGERLAGFAHRWKGSLGLLGARRALSCAVRLEDVCRLFEKEPERLLECFQRLHNELLLVERALSSAQQESVPCGFS